MKLSKVGFLEKFFSGSNSKPGFRFKAVLETLVFLAACVLINFLFFPGDIGFLTVSIHPFWIVILLISIRYGLGEGLISALCAGICYFVFSAVIASDYSITYPLLFLLTAGILGQNRDVLDRRYNRAEDRLDTMSEKLEAYKKRETAYRDTLSHFEKTIATQFSDAMDMFREMSGTKDMSPEEMKPYLLTMVKKFLDADKCTYFEIIDNNCYKIYDEKHKDRLQEPYPMEEDIILKEAYRTGQFAYLHYSSEEDRDEYGTYKCLLAGCLLNSEGEIMGLVGIESLPFASFNAQSFKLFSSLLEFWSGAINDRIILEKTREKNIMDEGFHIYKYNYFTRRIVQEFNRAREFAIPLSLTILSLADFSAIPGEKQGEVMAFLITIIRKFTTDLDMICHYRAPGMLAIIQPFHLYKDAEKQIKAIIAEAASYELTPYTEKDTPLSGGKEVLSLVYTGKDFQVGMESCENFIQSIEKELHQDIHS
jgi:polysaccharide biosynthesis protein PelD